MVKALVWERRLPKPAMDMRFDEQTMSVKESSSSRMSSALLLEEAAATKGFSGVCWFAVWRNCCVKGEFAREGDVTF